MPWRHERDRAGLVRLVPNPLSLLLLEAKGVTGAFCTAPVTHLSEKQGTGTGGWDVM